MSPYDIKEGSQIYLIFFEFSLYEALTFHSCPKWPGKLDIRMIWGPFGQCLSIMTYCKCLWDILTACLKFNSPNISYDFLDDGGRVGV